MSFLYKLIRNDDYLANFQDFQEQILSLIYSQSKWVLEEFLLKTAITATETLTFEMTLSYPSNTSSFLSFRL